MIATDLDGSYRVTCREPDCPRPLDRTVGTSAHAENLHRKHWREQHDSEPPAPETSRYDGPPLLLDLTAAARAYLRHQHREAAAVWGALVGVDANDTAKLTDTAEAARDAGSLLGYIPPL